ncbi:MULTISPECIES: hypothetical protein [unclassified Aureispira]|uniref:hypothetical protein n=1 Tax=unclassified Aureispira TaxID=2649989 RepID=UPI0006981285|nr:MULTISPECIES: hypothetical protein [unclassified Aureispira]WMX15720.1 hypothetical protein QP953_04905 [Aureispira sp. CCB-E]
MFWTAIAIMVIGGYYFDLQKQKLKQEKRGGANSKEVKLQLGRLMAENEEMKERIRNLEYLMTDRKDYIDIDYEKEQMRLDNNNNKFEY